MADPQPVRDWLTYLAGLNVGGLAKREIELRLDLLAPALADEFDTQAFTLDSARHVAAQYTHFPVFGEIVPALRDWWREHRPMIPAIDWQPEVEPIPERTPEELQHVSTVTKRILAELDRHNIETAARYRGTDRPISRRDMTRAELTEAYRRAGLQGPHTPQPVDPEHVGHC